MKDVRDRIAPLIKGYADLMEADTTLRALFPASTVHIRRRGSVQEIQTVPGIYWSIMDEIPRENVWSALVQWDVWAKSYDLAVRISDRLGAIMHDTAPRTVNGVYHWSTLESRGELPEADGANTRRINIYRYHPLKGA